MPRECVARKGLGGVALCGPYLYTELWRCSILSVANDDDNEMDKAREKERRIETRQVAKIDRDIANLFKKRDAIEANAIARDDEDGEDRERRLTRNGRREIKAEARYHLTGERRARIAKTKPVYVLWDYIFARWRKAGSPDNGVEIKFTQIQLHLSRHCAKSTRLDKKNFSERHIRGLISECKVRQALDVIKRGRDTRAYVPKTEGILRGDLYSLKLHASVSDRQ